MGEHGAAAIDDAARAALAGAAGESGCKTWREVFIDRAKGWKEATRLLQWLCSMGHPSDVSGKRHRTELRAALVYLFLGTMPSGDSSASSWQRQVRYRRLGL